MWPTHWTKQLLGLLLLLAAVPLASAEEVHVTVVAILATDQNKIVDRKVECLAKEVQKQEPALTGFKLKIMTCKPMTVGERDKFPLVDDQVAEIVIVHGANKENRVRLKIKGPTVSEVGYTTCCGKCFPIITLYETKNKERLIIAVMVEPCREK